MYVCVHTVRCKQVFMCLRIRICTPCGWVQKCRNSFLYMYIHTHIHTHMVCIYVHRAEKQSMPRHMHVKIVLMPFSLRFPSSRLSVQTYVDCAYIYIYIYTWVYVFEAAIRDEKESAEYAVRHTKGTRGARSLARSLVSHHFCLSFSSSGVT